MLNSYNNKVFVNNRIGEIESWHERNYSYIHEFARVKAVGAYQITNIIMTQNKHGKWTKKLRAMLIKDGRRIDKQLNFSFHELGKTVFTDEETAKQSLLQREFFVYE